LPENKRFIGTSGSHGRRFAVYFVARKTFMYVRKVKWPLHNGSITIFHLWRKIMLAVMVFFFFVPIYCTHINSFIFKERMILAFLCATVRFGFVIMSMWWAIKIFTFG
jgi:hypothetical protein